MGLDLGAFIAAIAALVTTGVVLFNRGRQEGQFLTAVGQVADIVKDQAEIQQKLSAMCERISGQACDLQNGSAEFKEIREQISSLRERVVAVETTLGIKHKET